MNKKKILLLHPRHENLDSKLARGNKQTSFNFPFGIGYIASVLENNGYEVKIFDAHAERLDKLEVIEKLSKIDFDILGISAFSNQYNAVKFITDYVKNKMNKYVIIGGPLATYSYELTLNTTKADVCVVGEGEETIIDLLSNLNNLASVKGIVFLDDNNIVLTKTREYIKTLDDLPRPAYHLFNMEKYINTKGAINEVKYGVKSRDKRYIGKKIINFITTRGCPYSCKFCSRNFYGARFMSIDKVVEELKFLQYKYGIEGVKFLDELFVLNLKRMKEFAEKSNNLNIFWTAQTRANLVNCEILKVMKQANCICVGIGIESGSQKILNNMDKKITVEQIKQAMLAAKKLDMGVKVQLIFGYPGEDESTLRDTIKLFKQVDHPGRRMVHIVPIPGSPLYEEVIKQGLIKDEAKYLCEIEKGFAQDKVLINFTDWPDEEIYSRKKQFEDEIAKNYYHKNIIRYLKYRIIPSLKYKINKLFTYKLCN